LPVGQPTFPGIERRGVEELIELKEVDNLPEKIRRESGVRLGRWYRARPSGG
jgi:hypothetical protein